MPGWKRWRTDEKLLAAAGDDDWDMQVEHAKAETRLAKVQGYPLKEFLRRYKVLQLLLLLLLRQSCSCCCSRYSRCP